MLCRLVNRSWCFESSQYFHRSGHVVKKIKNLEPEHKDSTFVRNVANDLSFEEALNFNNTSSITSKIRHFPKVVMYMTHRHLPPD
jgi:hypothetical protein